MITINCQSSIKLEGEKILYFDPLQRDTTHDADYIFITHTHWDHFSKEDIQKVRKDTTKIIGPQDILGKSLALGFGREDIILLRPYEEIELGDIHVKTVPAYNLTKDFHPKGNEWLGYVLTMEGTTYYIAGDTDALEENKTLACDMAFLPIGGTYTMTAAEAASFANELKPKVVVPIHYGLVVGDEKDLNQFSSLLNKEIQLEIKIGKN